MYLTEELFETADHSHYPPPKHMDPSQQQSPDSLGKRKRSGTEEYTPSTVPTKNIKISPPPVPFADCAAHCLPASSIYYPLGTLHAAAQTSPPRPRKRATAQPRSNRVAHSHTHTHTHTPRSPLPSNEDAPKGNQPRTTTSSSPTADSASPAPPPPPTSTPARPDLTPCHCCKRGPKVKQDLEGYLGCEACGRRSCFICLRQCRGMAPGCGERKICRACCVERGAEGETWCLSCLTQEDTDTVMG